ncbi:MAG: universal stress protein [Granulosicoccus sp.]
MSTTLAVGLDGVVSGERALAFGKQLAALIDDVEILVVYIIEWSPYSFQTAEENAQRHKRREEEIATAMERVVSPEVTKLQGEGFKARGIVRHGDVAAALDAVCVEEKVAQLIVSRSSEGGFTKRLFGSSTANLVMNARVPVTVVG